MLIPKRIFKVTGCATDDETRHQLCGAYFTRREGRPEAVATDGKALVVARWTEDNAEEFPRPKDCPEPTGKSFGDEDAPTGVILPTAACKEAGRIVPRNSRFPILQNAFLDEGRVNSTAPIVATDLDTVSRVDARPIDGCYPDYASCLSMTEGDLREEGYIVARVNPFILLRALKTLVATAGIKPSDSDPEADLAIKVEKCGRAAGQVTQPIIARVQRNGQTTWAITMPLVRHD